VLGTQDLNHNRQFLSSDLEFPSSNKTAQQMVVFASFPVRTTTPQVIGHDYEDEDTDARMEMDVDGYIDDNTPHLTCPGAPLTSSQAFMR